MSDMSMDLAPVTARMEIGELAETGGVPMVLTPGRAYRARRALSCLVEPAAGDRVMIAAVGDDEAFVLAVLERASAAPVRLLFAGDAEIYAPSGRIDIGARDGACVASPQMVELTSNRLRVSAVEAEVAFDRASYAGAWLSTCVDTVKLAAKSLDAVLDRWTQRVRQSLRRVDEIDQLKAGQIDHAAKDTLAMHGNNTLITASTLVRVDGKQIHVG